MEWTPATCHLSNPAEHYRLRGPALQRFNAQEYKACVSIKKKTQEERDEFLKQQEKGLETAAAQAARGRRPNATVCERPPHAPRKCLPRPKVTSEARRRRLMCTHTVAV